MLIPLFWEYEIIEVENEDEELTSFDKELSIVI